jgi:chromosome segregation ATPase
MGHLQRLDGVAAKAATDFEAAAQERLGGADAQLTQLQQANDAATAEIARHQKESAERMTQMAQIQQQRATDEQAIGRAKAKTEAASASVKQTLMSMQAMLSSLPV